MKNNIYISFIVLITTCVLTTTHAQTASITLASWDFSEDLAATTEATGIMASAVSYGDFDEVSAENNYGRSTANQGSLFARIKTINNSTIVIGKSEKDALTNHTYFEFSLKSTKGSFDLRSFDADIFAQTISSQNDSHPNGTPQAEYTAHYFLRSSLDNFNSNLLAAKHTAPTTEGVGRITNATKFSGSLNGITSGGAEVTFRIYVYVETTNPTAYQSVRIDNITIKGTPNTTLRK